MRSRIGWIFTLAFTLAVLAAGARVGAQSASQERPSPPRDVTVERSEVWVVDGGQESFPRPPIEMMLGAQGDANTFLFVSSEMSFDGKTVKGAPYSAQAVTETVQALADGNRIVRRNTAAVYRDSEGRTRREQTIGAVGPFAVGGEPTQTILINDPVAGVSYVLNPNDHSARKMHFKFEMSHREGGDKEAHAKAEHHRELRTEVTSGGGNVVIRRRGPEGSFAKPKEESLGKQMIEGVQAEGTRLTITIPAGQIGNEQPINIITERWYSPELQTALMHKHSDPRFGETTFRLTNISRSEPARTLFEVPSDYTIKEPIPGDIRMRVERELRRVKKPGENQF